MKLVLKNIEVIPAINFLQSMKLKASDSRHRSKLVIKLNEALDAFIESEKAILTEFDALDENNEVKKDMLNDQNVSPNLSKERKKLYQEAVTIEGGMFVSNFAEIPRILKEFEGEISGRDAEIYDRLLDECEKNEIEDSE